MSELLEGLTPSQRAAVDHTEGPLLVLAGPGSGKTRVITRRIARIVEKGASPREVLAITFTNKASREMAERVQHLMPGTSVWVSTFHRFCARLLREYSHTVGLKPNFTIYDTGDQTALLKRVISDEGFDSTHYSASKVGYRISQAKNDLILPEQFKQQLEGRIGHHLDAVVARVYPVYQEQLLQANAVDFDDLLLHVVRMLNEHDELRAHLDRRYRYVLVDEYQDTNRPQYQIVAALSRRFQNVCVTGDPDQSIYGWRGAQIENILRFERDFPDAEIVRLEQNFRSTPQILKVADQLIAHNKQRKAKSLVTDNEDGQAVELRRYDDSISEASQIASEIRRRVEDGERKWSDFAIFYRVNALSRTLETTLARFRVPYQIAGGVAFYERAEIKDLIAYLRLIDNPQDEIAFSRCVNTPVRGIGKNSQSKVLRFAQANRIDPVTAAKRANEIPKLPKRSMIALQQFASMIEELAYQSDGSVESMLQKLLGRTRYLQAWEDGPSEEAIQRLANVNELVVAARQYDEAQSQDGSLAGFLETASLTQDSDAIAEAEGAVTLMTLHSAKGLEFPVVYLVGVEHGLLPHERVIQQGDPKEIEEERRLLFVGITRAMEELYLTQTWMRTTRGRPISTIRSQFLDEMSLNEHEFGSGDIQNPFDQPAMQVNSGSGDSIFAHLRAQADRKRKQDPDDENDPIDANAPRSAKVAAVLGKLAGVPIKSGLDLARETEAAATRMGCPFSVGQLVRHPQYGRGTVLAVTVVANRPSVKVQFENGKEPKDFIANKCPLQVIGTD